MSDFLDRVAARVIGGDAAMLTPRIPSIYEPSQATANVPLEQSLSVAAGAASARGESIETSANAAGSETTRVLEPTFVIRDGASSRVRTQDATMTGEPASHSSVIRAGGIVRPSSEQHRVIEPLTHRVALESQAQAPSLARAAQPPVAVRSAAVPDHAVGVLLPPEQPVFGAASGRMAQHASAPERSRTAAVPARGETHEPVVHVSIGRIEVRAAATSASASRQQGGAPVDRLGDYLRERNKASP